MTKPEKRWQLLLVADDGRIVPFRRIKEIAVSLLVLLVLLGVACAGLVWQLTLLKKENRQALDRLAAADAEATHYRSEHELVIAELVLAEARMKKAGLEIPPRRNRAVEQTRESTPGTEPIGDKTQVERPKESESAAAPVQMPAKAPAVPPAEPSSAQRNGSQASLVAAPITADPSMVDLERFEIVYDSGTASLLARFRVNNIGPPSSPVAGRCVVVLKSDRIEPEAWLSLPAGALNQGRPDPKRGPTFRISRFIDMDVETTERTDPSVFNTAVVYVFDTDGAVMLEKAFPIDLPAAPQREAASSPAKQIRIESPPSGSVEASSVVMGDLQLERDPKNGIIRAQFRLTNTGLRSSPVAGFYVVVLKGDLKDPGTWQAIPDGALANGKLQAEKGQAFKISRYNEMTITAPAGDAASAFSTATVYVFDTAGSMLLENDFAIDLPALERQPEASATVAPQVAPEPAPESRLAPETDAPSQTEIGKPANQQDARARF